MTTFMLLNRFAYHVILNVEADFIVARVYPLGGQQGQYEVTSCFREDVPIAVELRRADVAGTNVTRPS
jgi:hypothetical protein